MTRSIAIAPSILSADFAELGSAVRAVESGGADAIHVDVMDGRFVPEISFGRTMVEALRRHTSLPMDVHLMVAEPQRHLRPFAESGAAAITVHCEGFVEGSALRAALELARTLGVEAGVAIKPKTGWQALDDYWDLLDRVLVMTVEPGYSGQVFMSEVLPKLRHIAERAEHEGQRQQRRIVVAVDGGVDEQTIARCHDAGASWIVAGSAVFGSRRTVQEGIAALRQAAAGS